MKGLRLLKAEREWNLPRTGDFGIPRREDCRHISRHGYPALSSSSDLMKELLKELKGKTNESNNLREKVEELERELRKQQERLDKQDERLKELFEPSDLPSLGEFEKWLASSEAIKKLSGKHIAYVEGIGVIAHSESLGELVEKIGERGDLTDIVIGFIPARHE